MALSRLSNMQGITQAFTTPARPTALSMMGAREERENAAKLAEYEAMTKRGTMMEDTAAGQAKRASQAQTALAFKSLPEVTAEVGTPEWVKQIQEQLRAAQNSGDPELQKWAITGYAQLDQVAKGAPINPNTLRGAMAGAQIENWQEEAADWRRGGQHRDAFDSPTSRKADEMWATAYANNPKNDPNRDWNPFTFPMSEEDKAAKAATLANTLTNVKNEFLNKYGVPMDEVDAQREALRRVQGDAPPPPPVPETLPPNTPMNTTTRSGRVIDGRR